MGERERQTERERERRERQRDRQTERERQRDRQREIVRSEENLALMARTHRFANPSLHMRGKGWPKIIAKGVNKCFDIHLSAMRRVEGDLSGEDLCSNDSQ
jgi:hypothetical protein